MKLTKDQEILLSGLFHDVTLQGVRRDARRRREVFYLECPLPGGEQ